ncbi:MAG: coproporphyrinogen-III oxidase family protein [Verrucomicrobiota bacterium]
MSVEFLEKLWDTVDSETEGGSYFLANYPPFQYWKDDESSKVSSVLQNRAPDGVDLGLYMHIPFCRKRCHFCYFRVYTDKNSKEVNGYISAAIRELEIYAKQPFLQGRKPRFVYFGGGTPSYLSAKQLKSLTDQMKAVIPWDEVEEVAFEGEPGTLNSIKLNAIREIGVTRLSMGVENFDDHVLEINGRAHRSPEVWKAMEVAKALDFDQINIDLIAGMLDETEKNWQRCVERTVELEPDSVTIYQMEVPYNTTIFKRMKQESQLKAPVADWKTKRRWVQEAFDYLERKGYTITSAYTAVKNPEKTKFVYRDALWSGADMVALGVASFSHLGGVHFQNLTHFDPYLDSLQEGKLPIGRALQTTGEEQMLREFMLQMKLGRVSIQYFENKFAINILERFSQELDFMTRKKLLNRSGDWLVLSSDTLLRVDALLPGFFLPEHQNNL